MSPPGHLLRCSVDERSSRSAVLAIGLAALALAWAVASGAHAASFSVDCNGDQSDSNAGNGLCQVAAGPCVNLCTLRAAIQEANALAGTDSVAFTLPAGSQSITLTQDLPPVTAPISISGAGTRPEINGNGFAVFDLRGGGSQVRSLAINRASVAIALRDANTNTVSNVYIGTDPAGTVARPNLGDGILISNSSSNIIGADSAEFVNVISGNQGDGVHLVGTSSGNIIRGNFIGLDRTGATALGNAGHGIHIEEQGGAENSLCTTTVSTVISGNGGHGVFIEGAPGRVNRLTGCFIGTDVTGVHDRGNGQSGVRLATAAATLINNLISGNDVGVQLDGSELTELVNNRIGTDQAGTGSLGNTTHGIAIDGGTTRTFVDPTNTIAFNGQAGIAVLAGSNNYLRGRIHSNGGLGIDLGANGLTPNDDVAKDADSGPNNLQNFPILTAVSSGPTGTTFQGTLRSTPNTQFGIDLYTNVVCDGSGHGEAQLRIEGVFIQTGDLKTDANGDDSFTLKTDVQIPNGVFVTATANDISTNPGSTSELSPCVLITSGLPAADLALEISDDPDPTFVGSPLFYTVSVHNAGPAVATGVTITVTLDPDVIFVAAPPGCVQGTQNADVITCTIGTLANGGDVAVTIGVTPFSAGSLETTATVSGMVLDPVGTNNSKSEQTAALPLGQAPKLQFDPAPDTVFRVSEGDATATIVVTRTGDASGIASVKYEALVDTDSESFGAREGEDFARTTGTLTFETGITRRTFPVTILPDRKTENGESLVLRLFDPSPGTTLGTNSLAGLRILDDDPSGIFRFPKPSLTVGEGAGAVDIVVARKGGSGDGITIVITESAGTAQQDEDWTPASGSTLSFGADEKSKVVRIPIVPDARAEGNETFTVSIFNAEPPSVEIGEPRQVEITIVDDDTPTKATFNDADGDKVTATLKGGGTLTVTEAPVPAGATARGALPATAVTITLTGTNAESSSLVVAAKKSKTGDGAMAIATIVADGGMKSISAKNADLVGEGIAVGGFLGKLVIRDILNGADVVAGGTPDQRTAIKARRIADDSRIDLGSALATLAAAGIGQSEIAVPSLGSLTTKGDKKTALAGDCQARIVVSGDGVAADALALGKLKTAGALAGVAIDVAGSIGSITAPRLLDSTIFAGFAPDDAVEPFAGGIFTPGFRIGKITITGATGGFANSIVAGAAVGKVKIASAVIANGGSACGVLASASVEAVVVTAPPFAFDPAGPPEQAIGDFHVRR